MHWWQLRTSTTASSWTRVWCASETSSKRRATISMAIATPRWTSARSRSTTAQMALPLSHRLTTPPSRLILSAYSTNIFQEMKSPWMIFSLTGGQNRVRPWQFRSTSRIPVILLKAPIPWCTKRGSISKQRTSWAFFPRRRWPSLYSIATFLKHCRTSLTWPSIYWTILTSIYGSTPITSTATTVHILRFLKVLTLTI